MKLKGIKNTDFHIQVCDGNNNEDDTDNNHAKTKALRNLEKQLLVEQIKNEYLNKILQQKLGIDLSSVDNLHFHEVKDTPEVIVHLHQHLKKQPNVTFKYGDKSDEQIFICEESDIVSSPKVHTRHDAIAIMTYPIVTQVEIKKEDNIAVTEKEDNIAVTEKEVFTEVTTLPEIKNDVLQINKKPRVYRVVKNVKIEEEETKEERALRVSEIESKIREVTDSTTQMSEKDTLKAIDECFEHLKNSKQYNKDLDTIRKLRNTLMCRMPIKEYIGLVKRHNQQLLTIFTAKQVEKRIPVIIARSMTLIELRLVFYDNYESSYIEIDDVESFDNALTFSMNFPKDYVVFSSADILNNMYNYNVALFPIEDTLRKFLFNRYEFYNLIYLKLPEKQKIQEPEKQKPQEPYSFYVLEDIREDNVRCWKMDCRLEDLSITFVNSILPFVVQTYRKIYLSVFKDNTYRSDYRLKSQITEWECEQLLRNIFTLYDPILFSKTLRDLVIKKAEYVPTNNDKFNLKSDDKMQFKRFSSYKPNSIDLLNIIKSLFDEISNEDATALINRFMCL